MEKLMGTVIRDMPILDLRAISAEDISDIDLVDNVRTVVLSTDNAEAFMSIPRVEVRSHLIVKPDETLIIGQIEFDDHFLNKLSENTKLVLLGHALIDGFTIPLFLKNVQSLRMYGQVLYSDAKSVAALMSRLERLQGQLLEMQPNAVRWIGSTYLDTNQLASVSGRPVISIGPISIDSGVNVDDITKNINLTVQIGEIRGTEESICALLSVCKRRLGSYELS
jgi:hypothetical protein